MLHQDIVMPYNFAVFYRDFTLLEDGDFIKRHIGSELLLQAVDVDKLTIEFLFILVELHELMFPLLFVLLHSPCQAIGIRERGVDIEAFACLLEMLFYKVIDIFLVGLLIDGQQFIALEVPTGFVRVPILTRDSYTFLHTISNRFLLLSTENIWYITYI